MSNTLHTNKIINIIIIIIIIIAIITISTIIINHVNNNVEIFEIARRNKRITVYKLPLNF